MGSTLSTLRRPHARLFVYNQKMKDNVNFYFAVLLIVIAAAGATWLIIHVVTANNFTTTVGGNEAKYAPLRDSILKQ